MTEIPHLPKAVLACNGDALYWNDKEVDQLVNRLIDAHRSLCAIQGLLPVVPDKRAEATLDDIENALSSLGIPPDYQDKLVQFSDSFKEVTGRRPYEFDDPQTPVERLRWYQEIVVKGYQ